MGLNWVAYRRIESLARLLDIVGGRARAFVWRLRGARLAPKVSVGKGCRVDMPWGLSLGRRTVLEEDVYVKLVEAQGTVTIGGNVFVGRGCQFDISDRLEILDHSLLAPGCFITDHNHGLSVGVRIAQQPCVAAPVRIGADVWLGRGVTILPGVSIGDGAVVGAGAVVTRDLPTNSIAVGVPAQVKGFRDNR